MASYTEDSLELMKIMGENIRESHCAGYSAVRALFCTGQRFLHSE